jgi:L-fucose isomerase-like protein
VRQRLQAPDQALRSKTEAVKARVGFKSLDEQQILAIVALHLALKKIAAEQELSAIALQCFPGFQQEFGIYPCLANSLLGVEGVPVICETDIHGAITACLLPPALRAGASEAATLFETSHFFADLTIQHPENDRVELLWHCGSFPLDLAADDVEPFAGDHFIMPGADAGVGHSLALAGSARGRAKGGEITIGRFEEADGDYYLALGHGRGTSGPATVGTYLWFEVDDWIPWERKFIYGPYIHHVAGVHGAVAPILYEAAKYLDIIPDPIEPSAQELEDFWWRL